jgi:hypothetical protein
LISTIVPVFSLADSDSWEVSSRTARTRTLPVRAESTRVGPANPPVGTPSATLPWWSQASLVVLAVVAAAIASGALAVSGCGGSETTSKDDYAESVVSARDRVDFALAQITVGEGTVEELIDRMETAADRIDEAADDLDDAAVAEGFETQNEKLVAAFRQLAAALAATAHDASQPGQEGLLTRTDALQFPGWVKANRILAELAEQGIDVEP